MYTPLESYGYVFLKEIPVPNFGTMRLFYKRDSEDVWLQRLDGSLKLLSGPGATGPAGPTGPDGPTGAPGADSAFYFQPTPPVSPIVGDKWMHSDTGILYFYVNDGNSNQWVQPY